MKHDVKSNYQFGEAIAANSHAAGAVNGASVDHSLAPSAGFFLSVGSVGAAGTADMKTQYSNDNSTWTDYPANDAMGNDDAITQITAAGNAELHIVNPRGRYSRVVMTVAVNAIEAAVVSVLGPLRHVDV